METFRHRPGQSRQPICSRPDISSDRVSPRSPPVTAALARLSAPGDAGTLAQTKCWSKEPRG